MFQSSLLFLAHHTLLLLFAVVALGYPLSKVRIAGASLGIASILFAGIGLISGEGFRAIVSDHPGVVPLFLAASFAVCLVADALALYVGYRLLRVPMNVMFGILAGAHTQPVILGYASQQTGNELPNVGFATVYPLATILKIILAQALLGLVR